MDHAMKVDLDAGYWLTATHRCTQCRHEAPVTVLVVTEGCEHWNGVMWSIDQPSFVIDVGCELPLEVVRQRWLLNPNLGMPTVGERTVSDLANVCQHCGTRIEDDDLVEPGGPFLPSNPASAVLVSCTPLEQPFTANEAEVWEEDALPGLLQRFSQRD